MPVCIRFIRKRQLRAPNRLHWKPGRCSGSISRLCGRAPLTASIGPDLCQHIMDAIQDSSKAHSPACSIIATAMPLVGAVLGRAIVVGAPVGDAGWPHVLMGPLVLPAFGLLGIILSCVAKLRRERHPWLSWLSLLLAIVAVVYGASKLGQPNPRASLDGEGPVRFTFAAHGLAAIEPGC